MRNSLLLEPDYVDFVRLNGYLVREKGIRERERTAPERLRAQHEKGMMVFRPLITFGCDVRRGHPLGCAVLWETADERFLEVGTVWTHVSYRRKGIQVHMVDELLELDAAQGKNLFAISSERSFGEIV